MADHDTLRIAPLDLAEYMTDTETQAEVLTDALESGDAAYVAHVLGTIARARGMAGVAKEAGLSRESLYRSLSAKGNPELATVMAVAKTLNLTLTVRAA